MPSFKVRNTNLAQTLRNQATPAERRLWSYLNNRQLGYRFNRQMPLGVYVCDFLCRSRKVVVELDGYSHDLRHDHDAARGRWLEQEGYQVLRFANEAVFTNVEGVVTAIREVLAGHASGPPLTPPASGRGSNSNSRPASGREITTASLNDRLNT